MDKASPIRVLFEFYSCSMRPYFVLTSCLLIIQMLKFKQKTRYETPRLPQIASTTSVLRKYYDGITVLN